MERYLTKESIRELYKAYNLFNTRSNQVRRPTNGGQIRTFIDVQCLCGRVFTASKNAVKSKRLLSCGCLMPIISTFRGYESSKHGCSVGAGATKSTYKSWESLRARCDFPHVSGYKYYGARGITYDPRWKIFTNFIEDMGIKPTTDYVIDRIDPDGNYCKDNCQWITKSENAIKSHIDRKRRRE